MGISKKLAHNWQGPFTVVDMTEVNLLLRSVAAPRKKAKWVHMNRCKHAYGFTQEAQPDDTREDSESENELPPNGLQAEARNSGTTAPEIQEATEPDQDGSDEDPQETTRPGLLAPTPWAARLRRQQDKTALYKQ